MWLNLIPRVRPGSKGGLPPHNGAREIRESQSGGRLDVGGEKNTLLIKLARRWEHNERLCSFAWSLQLRL
jgi:hypothetical protein